MNLHAYTKGLEISGLTLQFIAFWFAAPELLGEAKLRVLEVHLVRFLKLLPGLIAGTFGLVIGLSLAGAAHSVDEPSAGAFMSNLIITTLSYSVLVALYQWKGQYWVERRIALPLARRLVESEKLRMRSLQYAGITFTLGFLLLIIAAFLA